MTLYPYSCAGPTFRRGPPKGYIQALEARLHQMESVLAAIMSSKDARAVEIISDLRRDRLAKHILDGVDAGPFVRTSHYSAPYQTTSFAVCDVSLY